MTHQMTPARPGMAARPVTHDCSLRSTAMPTALLALHETTTPVTEVLGYRYDRHGMTAARIMAGGREFWVEGDGLADIIVYPEQAA